MLNIVNVDIESIFLDPANARKHGKKNLDSIKGSIKKFGQVEPLVVNKENRVVIGGNGRLVAMKELGFKTVSIVEIDINTVDATALGIALNRTGELAEWDLNNLGPLLKDLDIDLLADIGFDAKDLEKLMPELVKEGLCDEDEVPEVTDTRCKPGDLWQLGNHRLLCGDSTSLEHVTKLFTIGTHAEQIELCFTSPPYADQREYNGGKELSTEYLATFIRASSWACALYAVNLGISRKDNEINQYWDDYIREARGLGLKFLSWNVWNKQGAGMHVGNATAMFGIEHEWILVFGEYKKLKKTIENKHKSGSSTTTIRMPDGSTKHDSNPGATHRQLGTVWSGDVYRGQDGFPHPAMFPVALPEAYIEACTSSNGTVYEPFTGSGSTLIACEKTNRRCFGLEIDPHYCSVILARWEKFTGQQAKLLST